MAKDSKKDVEDIDKLDVPDFWKNNLDYGESKKCKNLDKCAKIRGDEIRECPFGLKIIDACENAGDSIYRLAPVIEIEDGSDKVKKANRLVYAYHKTGKRCPFAEDIMVKDDKVNCDYGDTAEGVRNYDVQGSPIYPSTFSGLSMTGMYGYPLSLYSDNSSARNLFYGLFSFLGSYSPREIVKISKKYNEAKDANRKKIINSLFIKIKDINDIDPESFEEMKDHLLKLKEISEDEKFDEGLIWKLVEKYYNSRQT